MADIKLIKELRERTGAGPVDCQKALKEANGNIEEAVTILRKQGIAKADKKIDRTASEGLVGIKIDGNTGVMIEVNSETDFVAHTEKFLNLCDDILDVSMKIDQSSEEAILASSYPGKNQTVAEELKENIAIIGENIRLRRVNFLKADNGILISYMHNTTTPNLGQIGVLVALRSEASKEQLMPIGKQIAMHIAATNPKALNANEINPSLIEKEKEIFKAEAQKTGKPENVIEKMVEGRIRKFLEESVLLEQVFVMDNKIKVQEFINIQSKDIGHSVEITGFVRYQVGEGIEKVAVNFADEVNAAARKS